MYRAWVVHGHWCNVQCTSVTSSSHPILLISSFHLLTCYFPLRYLYYELLGEEHRSRVHIFSSAFYSQLKDAFRDNHELGCITGPIHWLLLLIFFLFHSLFPSSFASHFLFFLPFLLPLLFPPPPPNLFLSPSNPHCPSLAHQTGSMIMSRYGQDMSTSLVKTSLCYPSLRHCRYQSGCFNNMEKFEAYGMARLYIQWKCQTV